MGFPEEETKQFNISNSMDRPRVFRYPQDSLPRAINVLGNGSRDVLKRTDCAGAVSSG